MSVRLNLVNGELGVYDDDGGPGHDAELNLDRPQTDVYDVWVGHTAGCLAGYLTVTGPP